MKPLELILSAFGSYGGTERVDFRKINQGLFLITGDTGAGKTTIFDGISYALYGQTSGRRRDGEMMRSQYASDDKETYVEFAFSEGEKIYKVRRNPAYYRQSRRKNKAGEYVLTRTGAGVELTLEDGSVFPGKMKETDKKIAEIVGMDAEQFGQVSMISQGDFMKLLLASSKDRKEIFSKIFSTKIYWSIQNCLAEMEKQDFMQLEDRRKQCCREIESIRLAPESEFQTLWEAEGRFSDIDYRKAVELAEKVTEEAAKKEKILSEELKKTDRILEAERCRYEADSWRKGLEVEIKGLEKTIEEDRLKAGRADQELEEARKEYDEKWTIYHKKYLILEEALPLYRQMEECRLAKIRAEEKLKRCESQLDENRKQVEKDRQLRKTLSEQQERLKNSGEALIQAEQAVEKWETRIQKIQRLMECRKLWEEHLSKYGEAKEAAVKNLENYRAASENYDSLYEMFVKSQAGWMAGQLRDGEPCPVCGSLHHPSPRKFHQGEPEVDKASVQQARIKREDAEKVAEKARENCQRISEEGVRLRSRILEGASVLLEEGEHLFETGGFWKICEDMLKDSQRNCREAEEYRETCLLQKKQYGANGLKIKELETREADFQKKYMDDFQKTAALKEEIKGFEERIKELTEKLLYASRTEAESEIRKLKKAMEFLEIRKKSARLSYDKILAGLQRHEGQMKERRVQKEEAEKQWALAETECLKYRQDAGWTDETDEQEIKAYRYRTGEEEKYIYSIRLNNQEILKKLENLLKGYEKEQEDYSRIRQLSRVANGQMAKMARIDFQTYMQRRYFRQIVGAANRRLTGMNGSQFLLECRDMDNLGRQGEVGLELDVYSLVNDKIRDIKTLSGGESFMAALALALGMADVIQQKAGKIHVDTLFIDEGFGSLDERARGEAMRILDGLAGTDCLVGIISHVRELKEQIGQKIIVEKNDSGSHIRMDIQI